MLYKGWAVVTRCCTRDELFPPPFIGWICMCWSELLLVRFVCVHTHRWRCVRLFILGFSTHVTRLFCVSRMLRDVLCEELFLKRSGQTRELTQAGFYLVLGRNSVEVGAYEHGVTWCICHFFAHVAHFTIFEICLDSNPEMHRSEQARYWFSHPSR